MSSELDPEEIENVRLSIIAAHHETEDGDKNPNWLEELEEISEPGSFGYHEAVHTLSIQMDMLERHLMEHPAILMDKHAFAQAYEAHHMLFELYTHLAARHIAADATGE